MEFVREFWKVLRVRKKFWRPPIVVVLALLGTVVVFTTATAVAPFIYVPF
jgi:hypothetical protein